jgi:hypothetical protein
VVSGLTTIGLPSEAIRQSPPSGTPSILIQTRRLSDSEPFRGLIDPVTGSATLMWTS